MQIDSKKAVVIGETHICTKCIEHLVNIDWKVIYVVSDDRVVIDRAKGRSVSVLPVSQLDTIKETGFYLFSVINPHIIPKSFLVEKKVVLALNYHDSPLPKYAGINSTTWAIINGEKQHGATIHKIEPGIDEGDIVAQSTIPIDKDETAISLNLKCSESALTLFKETIAKIEAGSLSSHKQDLKEKTYYGLKSIPYNYGVINGIKDIPALYRLVRGLTFGDDYDNPIASAKIYLNDNFYIVKDFNASLTKTRQMASSNINTDTTLFNEVKDIYGNKTTDLAVRYKDILEDYALGNDELQFLSTIKIKERKYKQQILDFLSNYPDASTKILSHVTNGSTNHNYIKKLSIPEYISTNTLLALINFVLARFFHEDFILSLYFANKDIPPKLQKLVENRNFICVQKDLLNGSFTKLEYQLDQVQKNCYALTKDFSYRHHLQLLTDIAITIGEVASIDMHKVVIKVKESEIEIQGSKSLQLQIDSIAEVLTTVSSKDFLNEIANEDLRYVNILNQKQYQQIVYEWNKTDADYPRDKTIHQLFEEQVLKTPDSIAVVYENIKITYRELNRRANQLANYLLSEYEIKPDDLIVLCLDRSEHVIIAMLGVLKAGGAYIPISPSHPDERVKYVLNNTKTQAIVTNVNHKNKLKHVINTLQNNAIKILTVDDNETTGILAKRVGKNLFTQASSKSLMYVIYTSGTTGTPKGVLVTHQSIVNFIMYMIEFAALNNKSVGSGYAAFDFDASVTEIYPILLSGGTLVVVPNEDRMDIVKINHFFNRHRVNYAFLPTMFAELFFELQNITLATLIVAGDKLNKFIKQPYQVINAYGPTEASVHTTSFIVDKPHENIPIGKPINNTKCYTVDSDFNLLPVGAIGELLIGGECLARGYLNASNLTAIKFVNNPFQTREEKLQDKNSRLYKTGDLVRMLPDGNIEYMGRNDSQVNIRGYRIELNEIENTLLNYLGIKQAAVAAKERVTKHISDKYLLAYYVANNKLDETKIQNYLATKLPSYMLPNALFFLQELPMTTNGKLDKIRLPETKFENDIKIEPSNEKERLICREFSDILGIKNINPDDDFFLLGGHSILAIKLVSVLQANFDIKVADIFNLRTPRKLVKASLFGKNFLQHKLAQVKAAYQKNLNKSDKKTPDGKLQRDLNSYKNSIEELLTVDVSIKKPINNVLLTGATGYLGCNVLNQLLKQTDYNVYLPVRANSQPEAVDRINKKYHFYFGNDLINTIGKKVFVFKADLEQERLGLPLKEYNDLAAQVDSVIHTAALVKHYGAYSEFYSANVTATINLLEFVKGTNLKDLHYVSSIGVLKYMPILNDIMVSCIEDDLPITSEVFNNVYIQTKLLGEHQVTKYQYLGLNCNIYRIGNLAFMIENYQVQENIEESAFYNWLRYLFVIQCAVEDINTIEISPPDLTAQAIVKIFDKKFLSNQTYHVFNSCLFDITNILKNNGIKIIPIDVFIDFISKHIENVQDNDLIMKFLLHQGWLDWWEEKSVIPAKILQDKTQRILKLLNFEWVKITDAVFYNYIKSMGFIEGKNE